jgi:hypothetical protein
MAFKCFPGYSYPGCINDAEGLSNICNPFTGKPQATRVLAASFIIQNSSFNIVFYGWPLGDEDVYFKIYIPIPSGKKALSLKNIFSRRVAFVTSGPGRLPVKNRPSPGY